MAAMSSRSSLVDRVVARLTKGWPSSSFLVDISVAKRAASKGMIACGCFGCGGAVLVGIPTMKSIVCLDWVGLVMSAI